MSAISIKQFLQQLNKNYRILQEREAKYATAAPLSLLNQLDDYETAINLTKTAIEDEVSLETLQNELSILNLEINTIVFVAQEVPRKEFVGRNPYRGLRKFTEDDSEFFFGRTAATNSLLLLVSNLIETQTNKNRPDLVSVLGASGSGKSSLVRAGLIPALQAGKLKGSENWPIKVMIPSSHPLDELASKFLSFINRGLPALRSDLERGPKALHQLMIESLNDKPENAIFILVIDQFEEVFTLCDDETERQAFLEQLLYVAQVSNNRGFIIITMRADFYSKVSEYKQLANIITQQQMLVSKMTEKELREAILLPAEAVGLELEKALVETLLNDTANSLNILPLLQHTLTELFYKREGNLLTLEAYHEIGGVKGALAHRADSILEALPDEQDHLIKRVFMRLVRIEENMQVTRRRATFSQILSSQSNSQAMEMIIGVLTEANLIVTDYNQETDEIVLDVAHEALLREWPRFQAWLNADQQGIRIRQQLQFAALDWHKRGRDNDSLYRGSRLLEVEEWTAQNSGELNTLEEAFITASVKARDEALTKRKRRISLIFAGLTVGFVLMAIATIYAFQQQNKAQASEKTAQASEATAQANVIEAERQSRISLAKSLGAQALTLFNATNNYELPILLAIEAFNMNKEENGDGLALIDNSLRTILNTPHFNTIFSNFNGDVVSLDFSPDGKTLIFTTYNEVYLWVLSDDEPKKLGNTTTHFSHLKISADGEKLVIYDYLQENNISIILWDLVESNIISHTIDTMTEPIVDARFSVDAESLNVVASSGSIYQWDLTNLDAEPKKLDKFKGWPNKSLSLFEQGTFNDYFLAIGSNPNTIQIWDLSKSSVSSKNLTGNLTDGFSSHYYVVLSIAFSADNKLVAFGSGDNTIQLFDLTSTISTPIAILTGHRGGVTALRFSLDGKTLASGGMDSTIHLWDLSKLVTKSYVLPNTAVSAFNFNTQNMFISETLELLPNESWEQNSEPVLSPNGYTLAIPYSVESYAVYEQAKSSIYLMDKREPNQLHQILPSHDGDICAVVFSADGNILASASKDNTDFDYDIPTTFRWWDLSNPNHDPVILGRIDERHCDIAFSADGSQLASTRLDRPSETNTIHLWFTPNSLIQVACQKLNRNLNKTEWERYLPDEEYRQTCANLPPHSSVISP